MRKMDRIDAWIVNNGGGHGLNVFNVSHPLRLEPPGPSQALHKPTSLMPRLITRAHPKNT